MTWSFTEVLHREGTVSIIGLRAPSFVGGFELAEPMIGAGLTAHEARTTQVFGDKRPRAPTSFADASRLKGVPPVSWRSAWARGVSTQVPTWRRKPVAGRV